MAHPITQIKRIASPNQQSVSLLDRRDPVLFLNTGQRGELQHSQRLPAQSAQGGCDLSANRPACHTSAAGKRIDPCRYEKRIGLGDRFAQKIDQSAINAWVTDTRGSEEELHHARPSVYVVLLHESLLYAPLALREYDQSCETGLSPSTPAL